MNKLDALLQLMRTPDKGFSIVESSRKRKWQEGPDQDWNRDDDGDDEDMDGSAAAGTCDVVFEAECWKRARVHQRLHFGAPPELKGKIHDGQWRAVTVVATAAAMVQSECIFWRSAAEAA